MAVEPPLRRVRWKACYRLVPSRYPPVGLFDRVAGRDEAEAAMAVEGLTNPRLRQEAGDIRLVPDGEWLSGPGTTPIMAALTHPHPDGGRFNPPETGAYYAARALNTAIREIQYHRGRDLADAGIEREVIEMRCYITGLDGRLHDVRTPQTEWGDIYHLTDYGAGQALAASLLEIGSIGVAFTSVRDPGGRCVGLYRPRRALHPPRVRQGSHLRCYWQDGTFVHTESVRAVDV